MIVLGCFRFLRYTGSLYKVEGHKEYKNPDVIIYNMTSVIFSGWARTTTFISRVSFCSGFGSAEGAEDLHTFWRDQPLHSERLIAKLIHQSINYFSHNGGATPKLVKTISDPQILGGTVSGTGTHVVLLPTSFRFQLIGRFRFILIWKVADASVGPFLALEFLCVTSLARTPFLLLNDTAPFHL